MYLNFIPFYDWIIFHCRYILHFVYPFIHCRTLYCFWNRLPLIGTWTHMLGLEPTWSEMKWKFLSCVQLFATPWTVHGILQARIPEWVAFPFSRGSSQPRDQTQVSDIAGWFFTSWATREALSKLLLILKLRKDNHACLDCDRYYGLSIIYT